MLQVNIPKTAKLLKNTKYFRINEFQEIEILMETDYFLNQSGNSLYLNIKERFKESITLKDEFFRYNNLFRNFMFITRNFDSFEVDKILCKYLCKDKLKPFGTLIQNENMFLEVIRNTYCNDKVFMI